MKILEPKPPGTLWATPGLLRESFTFTAYGKERTFYNKINERSFSTLYKPIVRRQKTAVCCGTRTIVFIRLHIKEGNKDSLKTANVFSHILYSNRNTKILYVQTPNLLIQFIPYCGCCCAVGCCFFILTFTYCGVSSLFLHIFLYHIAVLVLSKMYTEARDIRL
jgi:hypothetical protein